MPELFDARHHALRVAVREATIALRRYEVEIAQDEYDEAQRACSCDPTNNRFDDRCTVGERLRDLDRARARLVIAES